MREYGKTMLGVGKRKSLQMRFLEPMVMIINAY
jgi:hypothetical protein